ncbi:valacyclovir hydrolase [Venturia nashicola]|uniref:Valacyclovir hydrolase n=1 Tax=Venturia nashicola TaxID=86259 RepID=A0A4Z1PGA7_9PEZI|nr:valacyclovir hydrolase [Venturia nashicola]
MPELVLPRPGDKPSSTPPISGPTEGAFTKHFGTLLPPAKYLDTINGKVAYYELPPASPTSTAGATPDRVLFIHGVQTPALGMQPLASSLKASSPSSHFVLVDLWGHGLTDTPVVPHAEALFHKLIDDLLDELKWPNVNLIGFSFGGALTVGYVATRSTRIQSFTLIAPAGLIKSANLSDEEKQFLKRQSDEIEARKWVIHFLEGTPHPIVPPDWQERVARGEVVASAIKDWQMREHAGHVASVVAIFRDGGVMDNQEMFVRAAKTGIPSLIVLGAEDDICSKEELEELGFGDVSVVPGTGHNVVREKVPEVADVISEFWKKLGENGRG